MLNQVSCAQAKDKSGLNVVSGAKVSDNEADIEIGRTWGQLALLCPDFLLGPSGQSAVALDREAVAAVAATEATNAGAQAAESVLLLLLLLRSLGLLHGLRKGALGEDWQADGAGMLGAGVEVRGREEAANGRGSSSVRAAANQAEARGAVVCRVGLVLL